VSQKEEAFRKRLLETFRIEAAEHLKAMSSGLLELEQADTAEKRQAIVETVFREAHSLKGAARAVNVASIETTCQSMESVLAALKRGEAALSPSLLDALNRAISELEKLYSAADFGQSDEALVRHLENTLKSERPAPAAPLETPAPAAAPEGQGAAMPAEKPAVTDTIRIATAKLDAILLQAEELVSAKLAALQLVADLQAVQSAMRNWKKKSDRLHSTQPAHLPANNAEELADEQRSFLSEFDNHLNQLTHVAVCHQHALSHMVDHLLDETKKATMQSFSSLLDMFPLLVRTLARDHGKQAELVIHGADIEVDRRILEEMKDPLIHAIRNCIDHGIETPQVRTQANKRPVGRITIAIAPKGGSKVEILVTDDGAGIDIDKVKSAVVKHGLLTPENAQALDEQAAAALIFESGLTTSPIITDISGRGLGLAILREKAEKLGGQISVETRRNVGTTLRIVLPLALATFRGVLVQTGDRSFICPSFHVDRVLRIKRERIKTVENRETIELDQKAVALVRLSDVLKLAHKPSAAQQSDLLSIVLLRYADTRIGCAVDRIVSEQEFLVKSLGSQLVRVTNIAGATMLGDGQLVPVLNVADLVQSASKAGPTPAVAWSAFRERRSVLVVEDSITTRMLLKNILEASGWIVKTAVDGVDALTTLKVDSCDLVVSDVDMPRMNGFDLTARIRADRKLAELPVVLVTALESREDKERGIDVGANAYIVKSSFDQSKLIEVMNGLV